MTVDRSQLADWLAESLFKYHPDVVEVETITPRATLKVEFRDGTWAYVEVEIHGR